MPASTTTTLASVLHVWPCEVVCRTWFRPCQGDHHPVALRLATARDWSSGRAVSGMVELLVLQGLGQGLKTLRVHPEVGITQA